MISSGSPTPSLSPYPVITAPVSILSRSPGFLWLGLWSPRGSGSGKRVTPGPGPRLPGDSVSVSGRHGPLLTPGHGRWLETQEKMCPANSWSGPLVWNWSRNLTTDEQKNFDVEHFKSWTMFSGNKIVLIEVRTFIIYYLFDFHSLSCLDGSFFLFSQW